MKIAFEELVPTYTLEGQQQQDCATHLQQALTSAVRKRILYQSICALLMLCTFGFFSYSLVSQGSWFLSGIALSSWTFSVLLFYLVALWQEGEWTENLEEIIETALPSSQEGDSFIPLLSKFAMNLAKSNEIYFSLPPSLQKLPLATTLQTYVALALSFFFWRLKLEVEEQLYRKAAQRTISSILISPLDPKLHAELANTYVALAKLFQGTAIRSCGRFLPSFLILPWTTQKLTQTSKNYAQLALEELKILASISPDTLWVHEQLAISYKELEKTQEEFEAWNKVIQIAPDDIQALVRIGHLAFELKKPKDGLAAYERLRSISPLQADEVIAAYSKVLES